jgi:spermidine/putrescine transport system substrate-binding protein
MKIAVSTFLTRTAMILFWCLMVFASLNVSRVVTQFGHKKSISLLIWPMILDPHVLADFERKTGIKVYLNYYESNEELLSKLHATQGKDCDLIVPTDYMVEKLIQDGLLKKLDTTKLPFINQIRPYFLHHYYDPQNLYSVPYYVCVFGLGINKNYFNNQVPEGGWRLVFDKNYAVPHMSMLDSAREAIMLAAFYKYGTIEHLNNEQLAAIEKILCEQKSWIDLYTSTRVEELLASGSCPLAVGTQADIWKAQRECSNIAFVIPQEGSFVTIDSFVIPKATQQDELVYTLLNFLYEQHVLEHNSAKYGFCSPLITSQVQVQEALCLSEQQFKRLHFFKNVLPLQAMQDIWISVKAQ